KRVPSRALSRWLTKEVMQATPLMVMAAQPEFVIVCHGHLVRAAGLDATETVRAYTRPRWPWHSLAVGRDPELDELLLAPWLALGQGDECLVVADRPGVGQHLVLGERLAGLGLVDRLGGGLGRHRRPVHREAAAERLLGREGVAARGQGHGDGMD